MLAAFAMRGDGEDAPSLPPVFGTLSLNLRRLGVVNVAPSAQEHVRYNFTMYAHRAKVTIPQNHEVVVRVPDEFPPGEAEILVFAKSDATPAPDIASRLERWIASLPSAPAIPLTALDRGDLHR